MPARCVPEEPTFATSSEREVWERLRDSLPSDCVLMANLRLTDQTKDHEADLVVLIPEAGILILEVKGGAVWHNESGWWIRRAEDQRCYPVDQARDAKYALRTYVEHDPRWGGRGHVAWSHGVVLPHSVLGNDFSVPDLPRWALHDRHDQENLAERVRDNGWGLAHDHPTPNHADIDLIVEILGGRHHTSYDINADAEERASSADRLTQEQMFILQVTRLLRRVEVRGGAGSGKTVLALQKAKDLTCGRGEGQRSERVALLCYSIGLAEFLKRETSSWPRKQRPAFVGTYEELGRQWGIEMGTRDDSDFWERQLPRLMAEKAQELTPGHRFDSVVVDEAQDFADSWWESVLGALRDEEEGGVFVFSDENQRLFARFGRPPVELLPLVLDHNLRNTKQIYDCFGPLAPTRMQPRGGEGADVGFVAASSDEALDVADDQVEQLLDQGWDPAKICLLTTGHRHPEQKAQVDRHGPVGYWRSFWEGDDVFYGHVLGSKGLERAAVVLCVNEAGVRDRARERLYVGMSRATDVLIVVGDPQVVRRVGGDVVANRLRLPA
ncbi:ATP-binding domain-containing protein [Nocardioides salsibiostraticola]